MTVPVVALRRLEPPLAAVLLTLLVAHVALTPQLSVRGTAPDALLVGVAAVAVGRGSRAGAAFGFTAGLGADLFLATPLGTSALAFTLVGHVLGRASAPAGKGAVVLAVAGVGAGRLAAAAVATAFGGVPFPGAPGLLRIAAGALLSAPFGPPVFAAVGRLPSTPPAGARR